MKVKISYIFNIFLFFEISFSQSCFDLSYDLTSCRTCDFDSYQNTSFQWNSSTFPPVNCQKKLNDYQTTLYVDSSFDCSSKECNGTISFPFNDLFLAFQTIMINTIPYLNASVQIYLFGSMSHSLYTNVVSNQGFFLFRRLNIIISVETLLCSEMNITGCHKDQNSLAEILIKRNDILFFVSNQITLKNLKFNFIDMLAYNQTNDAIFKEKNKNNAFCSETDIINYNPQKPICFIQNTTFFLTNLMYGLFNLEILYDNPAFSTPTLIMQNCVFIYMNLIDQSSSFMQSLISVMQGSAISISIENTIITKFLSMKGVLNLIQNPDTFFYVYVSIPNLLKSLNPGFFNVSIINSSITEFNNFNFSLSPNYTIDYLSMFSLHNNKTSGILPSFPSLNVFLKNNTFKQLFNLNSFGDINFYFIRISGFNNNSNFSTLSSDFSNNSYIYFVHIWDFANIKIVYSNFLNNWNISFFFSKNLILLWNNVFENISSTNYSLFYVNNNDINMMNCSFVNLFLPGLSIFQEFNIWGLTYALILAGNMPINSNNIFLTNNVFRNITSYFLFQIQFAFNFIILNNIFESLNLISITWQFPNSVFKIQGVNNLLYFSYTDYYAAYADGYFIAVSFVGNLIHYSNLNLKYNYLSGGVFAEMVQNSTNIIDNVVIEFGTGQIYQLFRNNDQFGESRSIRVTNCVFSGTMLGSEPKIFNLRLCTLILFNNITFNYLGTQGGPSHSLIYFGFYLNTLVNSFMNFTNVVLNGVQFQTQWVANVYIYNCSFSYPNLQTSALYVQITEKGNFYMANTNFSNMNTPCLYLYVDKFTNLLIKNCLFMNTAGIFVTTKYENSNFDLNSLLNGHESDFYFNYYQYCKSQVAESLNDFDPNLSFEFCLNYSINNSTIFSINDVLVVNMTQWFFLFLNNYGIISTTFIGDTPDQTTIADIVIPNSDYATNILLINCTFQQKNFAKFNLITANSYAIAIINCSFVNFSSPLGGKFFSFIRSNLTILNSVFINIYSLSNGAIFNLQETNLTIYNCTFKNVSSKNQGSVFYLLKGLANISDAFLNDSQVSLKGAHLYAENGQLLISNSVFAFGVSNYGGSLHLAQMGQIFIINSSFSNITSQKGGIYIEGIFSQIYNFYNVSFKNNLGVDGITIYSKDSNINIDHSMIEGNQANSSILFFTSSFFPYNFNVFNILMENNVAFSKGFYIEKSKLLLNSSIFNNNVFNYHFFDILSCSDVKIFNTLINYDDSFNSNTDNIIIFSIDHSIGLIQNFYMKTTYYSSCMFLSASIFDIKNSEFEKCRVALAINKNSSLDISFSNFNENTGDIGAALVLSDCNLSCFNTSFRKNSANQGSDIYFKNTGSSLKLYTLKDIVFESFNNSSIYFLGNFSIFLQNISFHQESLEHDPFLQAIYGEDFNSISLSHCIFTNLKHMSALKFINNNPSQIIDVNINYSKFLNCSSDASGGALFLSGNMSLEILESEFIGNSAETDGGAIDYECEMCYLSQFILQMNIKNNNFTKNSCKNSGGAIKALDLNDKSLTDENSFQENFAQVGSNFSTKPHKIYLSNNNSLYNQDNTQNISAFNFSKSLTNFTAQISHFLVFYTYLLDKFDNLLVDENTGTLQISNANSSDSSLKLLYSTQKIVNGQVKFNISIVGKINTPYNLTIVYTLGNVQINQNFGIFLEACQIGEYQSDSCQGGVTTCNSESPSYINSQCMKCGLGFYSLDPKQVCTLCVYNANCPGGNLILPVEGYWRRNENSSKILKCANIHSCPDQSNITQHNSSKFEYVCGTGSFGNLCLDCDNGYGISSDQSCIICKPDAKVIILAIFNFCVLVYQSLVVFNVGRRQSISRSLLKLMVNHTNYVTLLSTFSNLMYSDRLNMILGLKDSVSTIGTITDSTILDCLINKFVDKKDLVMTRIALFSFFPIIIFLFLVFIRISLICIARLILKRKKGDENLKMIAISCFILVIYSFYPKLVYNAFSLLKCIPLDNTENVFLEIEPNIECWENDHLKYLMKIFLPNFLLYCFGWPLLLFFMLFRKKSIGLTKMRKSLNESALLRTVIKNESALLKTSTKNETIVFKGKEDKLNMSSSHFTPTLPRKKNSAYTLVVSTKQEDDIFQSDKMYSYITIDYANNSYFWDSFFFITNLILISVSVGSHKITTLLYVAIIIGMFTGMLIISKNIQPFRYREINNLMYFSYIALITTFCCVANLIFLSDDDDNVTSLYFIITLGVNGLFYIYWFYLLIYASILPKINENIAKMKEKLAKNKRNKKENSKRELKSEETLQTKKEIENVYKKTEDNLVSKTDNKIELSKTEVKFEDKSEERNLEIPSEKEKIKKIPKLAGDNVSIYDE